MSPSPPLRKSGKDAPFEAGLLTHGLHWPTLRAFPSCGTVAFSSRISLPFTVARAVAVLHRSSRSPLAHRVYQRRGCKERSMILQSFPCPNAGLQQVGLVTRRELTECVEAVNWTAKIQTPSISCVEDRGRLRVCCLRDQRSTPLALSRSVSGRFHLTAGKVSWLPARTR